MSPHTPAPGPAADAAPGRVRRSIPLQIAAGALVALCSLTATFGLVPVAVWACAAAVALALLSLALDHPLRGRGLRSGAGALRAASGAAAAATLGIAVATGGFHSVLLPVDLLVFSLAAAVLPRGAALAAALLNCAILAVPAVRSGLLGAEWRNALAGTGAFVAAALIAPLACAAAAREVRRRRRLEAAAELSRALATLDLDRMLETAAAQSGLLAEATMAVVVLASDTGQAPAPAAVWAAPAGPGAAEGADGGAAQLEAAARRAVAEGRFLRSRVGGAAQWLPAGEGKGAGRARGLAVPMGGEQGVGAIAAWAGGARALRPDALEALRELAEQAAAAVRATALHEEARRQALIDPVTRLYNARYLSIRLAEEVARARRHAQPLSLLFIDSDSLKAVNDQYGHAAGDRLVAALAQSISRHTRAEDVAVRYTSGDEFIVLLPGTNWPEATEIAERLRRQVSGVPLGPQAGNSGTVSIGVAALPAHAATADELIAAADAAMYAAKTGGKDRVAVYGPGAGGRSVPPRA